MTQAARPENSGRFISVRVKLLVGFTLLFGVVFAAAFLWFYTYASGVAEERLRESLHNALVSTAARIDGDEFLALYEDAEPNADGYTDDPRYWEIAEWLHDVHEIDQRAWTYTYVEGDEPAEVNYVVSSGALEDPPWGVKFRDSEITTSGSMQAGLVETSTFLDRSYEWEGTNWVSGYTPIYSPTTGDVVGGVGIDYNAGYVDAVRNDVRNKAIPAFILVYSILFVLVYLVSSYFTRPIVRLTKVAERIGEGDYNQDVSNMTTSALPDEITTLARVFNSMTAKVEKREEQLKTRVAELEITLDLSKRDEQVSEIIDSDFFQELQVKAKEMRDRKHKPHRSVLETADKTE